MTPYDSRVARFREWMKAENLDAMLVSSAPNVRWLTGFAGEGLLVADAEGLLLCTDSRYVVAASEEAPDVEVAADRSHLDEAIEGLSVGEPERVGFESAHLAYASYEKLEEELSGSELAPCVDEIKRLRAVKDADEVETIRRAAATADAAFEQWRADLRPGVTERSAAMELHRLMVEGGAEKPSFEIIMASGPNGAKPHARPTNRKIARDELIVVDWGAVVEGYCSDCTRTIVLGEPDERQREVWEAVRSAQLAALEALEPDMECREVDEIARELLRERGWEEEFGHGLGHGVGLEVHENPTLSQRSEQKLEVGMVVTIEPGVYIEGWGGVRLEELVVVTEEGADAITLAPYDL